MRDTSDDSVSRPPGTENHGAAGAGGGGGAGELDAGALEVEVDEGTRDLDFVDEGTRDLDLVVVAVDVAVAVAVVVDVFDARHATAWPVSNAGFEWRQRLFGHVDVGHDDDSTPPTQSVSG